MIPFTLAENAGLNPITIVTELRNRHANGEVYLLKKHTPSLQYQMLFLVC